MGVDVDDTLAAGDSGQRGGEGSLEAGTQAAGRYRIVRFVAAGAMGEVYAADDLVVGGTVALKFLRRELEGSSSAIERLRREIALARKVTSAHVCRLHDVGEHAGRVFLTMELLDGKTLADHVKRRGALPVAEVEQLAEQLIAGLAALHREGIVHRDLKTANVLLVGDRAVITDLGLARSVFVDGDPRLTVESGMLGTPAYMAPEQVEARPTTPASDVYALGVVLYELLTGKLPFDEDTAMATATARLYKDPPAPSSVADGIPARWDAIVMRCLARDPAERFASVEDVLGAKPRRRFPAIAGGLAAVTAVGMLALWRSDPPRVVVPVDDACPSAVHKLIGVWDPYTRMRARTPFEANGKGYVIAVWKKHAAQFDNIATRWAAAWDAACTADRTADPMLYGQRLVCLEGSLDDLRSYVGVLTKPGFAVAEFVGGSPAEFPIKRPEECTDVAELRAQPPPPPIANRAEVAALKEESNQLRARLRLTTGGAAVPVDRPAIHARLDEIVARCEALGAPSVALGIQYWRVMFTPSEEERATRIARMIELAERTRDDKALVGALNLEVRMRLIPQPVYDIAAAEAVLARAHNVAARVGNPRSLQYEIVEAERFHAQRARRYDDAIRALREEAALIGDTSGHGIALRMMRVQFRMRFGDLDLAEATAVARDREAQLGPADGVVAWDQATLAELHARMGNLAKAHELAQRGVDILEPTTSDPHQREFVLDAHRAAFVHAFGAGHRDIAARHLEQIVALREDDSAVAAYSQLADTLRLAGRRSHAEHVLAVADPLATTDADRALIAAARAELQLEAGTAFDRTWEPRLQALPARKRHMLLALIDARSGRTAPALAHADALETPEERGRLRARVLLAIGRARESLPAFERYVAMSKPENLRPAGLAGLWLGQALLDSGDPAKALRHLENAAWILGTRNADSADARFAWARAIIATGGDRDKAKQLAITARDAFVAMGLSARAQPITSWLATTFP